MKMRRRAFEPLLMVPAVVLFWLVTSVACADTLSVAGTTIVHVIGGSGISGDNPTAHRDAAIQNGLASAVYEVMAKIYAREAITANFHTLNQIVISSSERYIEGYKVIAESRMNKTYRVLLEVIVSEERLKSAGFSGTTARSDVVLVIEGTSGNIAGFVKLRGRLTDTAGVKSVQVAEMTADSAHLAVAYQGTAQDLAGVLQTMVFDTLAIDIVDVGENSIRLHLNPR